MIDTYLLRDYIYLRNAGGMSDAQLETWLTGAAGDSFSESTPKAAVVATIKLAISDFNSGKIPAPTLEDRLRSAGIKGPPKRG